MNNDKQLHFDVEQELRSEPRIQAEQIGVSVKDGVVQLDGHVDSWYEKWAAECAALRVSNAKAVACEIEVRRPSAETDTDEDIARIAMNTLERRQSVPNTVKVQVTGGKITLSGVVASRHQRGEAEKAVRPLKGVTAVFNDISVKAEITADEVKVKI